MIPPLTTLQAGWQLARNMPWRLIVEGLGIIMIFILIWALKNSWQDAGKYKTLAEERELDLHIAGLALERYEKSQATTDKAVLTSGDKKEKQGTVKASILKDLRDNAGRCPDKTGVTNEDLTSQPVPVTGITDLKRVLDTATCTAKGRSDCAASRVAP